MLAVTKTDRAKSLYVVFPSVSAHSRDLRERLAFAIFFPSASLGDAAAFHRGTVEACANDKGGRRNDTVPGSAGRVIFTGRK